MEKAPISFCIIVKNDPNLKKCVESIRDYVEEIVIVDTGSTDGTAEVARNLADVFEVFTACNDPITGLIEDFSMARQRVLELSNCPWKMWGDSDDIIELNHIDALLNLTKITPKDTGTDTIAFMFPYQYSFNDKGECTCLHYRERLVFDKTKFHWTNPVHEVLVENAGVNCRFITDDSVVFKHQRQYSNKPVESGRNLRIMRKYFEKVGETDARQMYYLGLECFNNGLVEESIKHLSRYVDISGWGDERALACLKLVDIYQAMGDYDNGLKWAFKTISIKEDWCEGYLALGKMFYFLAQKNDPNEMDYWKKCAYFIKIGLNHPPTKTLLFINPLDREYDIHRYYNMALNKLGDVIGALESANIGLKSQPDDEALLQNKKLYEVWIAKKQLEDPINKLIEFGEINKEDADLVGKIVNKLFSQKDLLNNKIITSDIMSENWKIPEFNNFDNFPIKLTDNQLQSVVIMIWKQFMLHDEILSAISFLENSPYNIRHSSITQKALKLTKGCLAWINDEGQFQKTNAPANPEVEAGNPLPNKLIMAEGHRFDFIADNLPPNSTIIDFGSMDGCFTNRYGMLGHKVVGLDACESSVKLAQKKAIEFNTGAEYICTYFKDAVDKVPNNYFEYATSTDTYEHLNDPINDMFLPAKKMLKPDGKFLLATPHGAWMRGQMMSWADPWIGVKEGRSWLECKPRPHIVAPTVWSVVDQFRKSGYWVKNCYPDLCDNSMDPLSKDIIEQGNIFAEAHIKGPEGSGKKLDIVFFAGDGVENYTPETIKKTGMGGSELMLCEISKRLAGLGHKVRVYNSCGISGEGIYDGVEYYLTEKYQDLECDVLVVSRRADVLSDSYGVKARLKLLWVHDVVPINFTNELLLKADRILCLSEWHKQNVINVCNVSPEHIIKTRNGVDISRFEGKNIKRDKFKCVNFSSPDRSWPVLLQIWPRIKERVPAAILTLGYGFKNWEYVAQHDQLQMDLINRLKNQIKKLEPFGVRYLDRVNQEQVAEEYLSASVVLNCSFFTETSYIGGMECTAAGTRFIGSSIAAVNETIGERGILIPGEWTSKEYQDRFVDSAVSILLEEE